MSENSENPVDFTRIEPWNSRDFPIKINSIRYNQDFSLLTLGTSKGYKIFSTSNLREVNEPSDEVTKLDDINIALCYYNSSLIFMLPTNIIKIIQRRKL